MKRIAILLLLALMAPALNGCPAALQVAAAVASGASWLSSVIDTASAGSDRYFARHPSAERQASVTGALERARKAAAALEASAGAAERQDALAAYLNLRALLLELGVLGAVAPDGGAESDAPAPQPFTMPDADEAKAKLGA